MERQRSSAIASDPGRFTRSGASTSVHADRLAELLRAVVANTQAAVYVKDLESRFLLVNAASARLLGTTPEEAVGQRDEAFMPIEFAEAIYENDRAIVERRERTEFEESLEVDGETRTYVSVKFPVFDERDEVIGVGGISSDITDRVHAEQDRARLVDELREERDTVAEQAAQLDAVLDSLSDVVIVYDIDGVPTRINPAGLALLGHDYTGVARRQAGRELQLRDLDDRPLPIERYPSVRATAGGRVSGERFRVTAGGRDLVIEASASPLVVDGATVGAVAVWRDVSEQMRLAEEIAAAADDAREQATRLDSVFASLADGVIIYDTAGRIVRWNDQASRLLGYTEEDRHKGMERRLSRFTITDEYGRVIGPLEFPSQRALLGEVTRARVLHHQASDRPGLWLSISSAPIRREGEIVGAVTTLLDVTVQMELSRRQSELIGEVTEANRELRAIQEVMDAAIGAADLHELLDSMLERLVRVMEADAGVVLLVDGDRLVATAAIGVGDEARCGFALSIGEGFAGRVAASRSYRYVADAQENPIVLSPFIRSHGIRSMLGVPLLAGEDLIGVLHIDWTSVHPEEMREVRVLELAADRMALSIRNAQYVAEREASAHFSAVLNEIDAEISSTLDIDEILARVVDHVAAAVDADAAAMFAAEEDGWRVMEVFGLDEELVGHWYPRMHVRYSVLAGFEPDRVLIDNEAATRDRYHEVFAGEIGAQAVMDLALQMQDEVIGDLALYRMGSESGFTEAHRDFLRKVGASVTLALNNAQLYAEEATVADTLQRALLQLPACVPGVAFECLYVSATETASVGGDFYDLYLLPDGRVGVLIGDVSGKGLVASTLTSLVRNTLRAYAHDRATPSQAVAKTNRLIAHTIDPGMFMTILFGVLDTTTGAFEYTNAGHPAGLVLRSGGGLVELEAASPLIGAFDDLEYASKTVTLGPGDRLLLYTDGVIEARAGDELFGEERLLGLARELAEVPVDELPRRVYSAVTAFTGGSSGDDVAMLALRLDPDGEGSACQG